MKYYKRKIVKDRRKSRPCEPIKSEDDERTSLTPIRNRSSLIKSKPDSYIEASDKSEDYLKLTPKLMKSKKQRITIQCNNDKKNDEVIQRKYKRTENEKIKKKVSDNARKQVIEKTSSNKSDEHSSSLTDVFTEIKNDKPQRDISYDLETDSMKKYDADEFVHNKIESSQKQSLQMKLKEIDKN